MQTNSVASVPAYEQSDPGVILEPRFPRVAKWRAVVLVVAFLLAVASSVAGATFARGGAATSNLQTGVTQCPM